MSIENHVKLIVAPQIVIYKNIFDDSKNLINFVNSENCIFGEWNNWFKQGYRKGPDEEYFPKIDNTDMPMQIKQKILIKKFFDIAKFIRKDYFTDYNQFNSIWPNFIKDWDKVLIEPEGYDFDIFKWSFDKVSQVDLNIDNIMMPYHVDDWDREGNLSYKKNIVTINVYLNDDYEGGEICAYDLNTNKSYTYKPSPGDAVVMPSHSPFYHAVKYFKEDDRYFMRTFFKYDYKGSGVYINKEELSLDTKNYVDKDLQTLSVSAEEIRVF